MYYTVRLFTLIFIYGASVINFVRFHFSHLFMMLVVPGAACCVKTYLCLPLVQFLFTAPLLLLWFAFCLCLSCAVVWWRQRSSLAGEALIACCAFNTHALPLAINGGSRALLARSIHAPRHAVHFLLFFCFCAGQLRFVCARMYAYCVLCGVLVAQHRERYLVMFARAPQSFEFLVICWWPWLFLSLDNSKPAS